MARNPGKRLEEWVKQAMQTLYEDAKLRKMSGALHGDGDVTAGPFEFECKDNPEQKSISVTEADWKRTVSAARQAGKIPVFVNENKNGTFVTMQWSTFYRLIDEALGNQ
ncbi:MAG: hypothetical protein GTO63_34290 [Anaerolineae bacterium]|nr:hypothetical protein [Anaerolineae bacterium]NIN99710.1 hypothetical protein [Anaerolineae bacterium]NIQ82562.1 hypothetical protein [Anaerolineae bacterium]